MHSILSILSPFITFLQEFLDRECLILHAEILVIMSQLHISYKDAAHRLYMREIDKLKSKRQTERRYKNIKEQISNRMKTYMEGEIINIDAKIVEKYHPLPHTT